LEIKENSVCGINKDKNKKIAEVIEKTSLIIWDEAPVNHRFCFETLDRTLRDVMK
jgi:hypothetical protein